jgi:vitamin B12 transporter
MPPTTERARRVRARGRRGLTFALAATACGAVLLRAGAARAESETSEPSTDEPPLEVFVTEDARAPASSRDRTAASTVIRKERLQAPGSTSADVLQSAPGVQVQRSGSGSDLATASLRGASSAQTPIYLAGVRLNDDVTGTADLSTVPLWMLDRVEVFRGTAPEHADQLGLGGAVFFEPRLPARSEVRAGQLVGSWNTIGTWAAAGVAGSDVSALVSVRRDAATNDYAYRNDRGTVFAPGDDAEVRRENADFETYDVWTIGRFRLGRGARITTMLESFDREQGVTGLAVLPALGSRARVRRQLAAVSAAVPCRRPGGSEDRCQVEFTSSALMGNVSIDDPFRELGLLTDRVDSAGLRLTEQARVRYWFGERWQTTVGLSQSLESLDSVRMGANTISAQRQVTRPALSGEVSVLDELSLVALLAGECHTTRAGGQGETCGVLEPTARLGARLRATEWATLLGNVGRYVRVPSLGELYGVSPLVLGDDELEPETGIAADAGARLSLPATDRRDLRGYLEIFGFQRHSRNLIAYRRSSFRQIRPYNVGRARVRGLEIAAGGTWLAAVRTETALTLLDPRDTTRSRPYANDVLPYRSRLVLSQLLEIFDRDTWSALGVGHAALGVRISHRSSRHQNPAGIGPIPHHTSVDLEGVAKLGGDHLALRATLTNLFDTDQFDAVGLPLAGRGAFASAEVSWW